MDEMEEVKEYYNRTRDRKPARLLVEAVGLYEGEKGVALDLGAGALRDSKYLLEHNFSVTAVDSSELLLEEAESIVQHEYFFTVVSSFDRYEFPNEIFDLVNAQYALPSNPPETFNEMFARLCGSLKKSGIFVGQFFGKNDSWNIPGSNMSFHSKDEVGKFLKDFSVIKLDEKEEDVKSTMEEMKHWHIFDVIAKKNS